MSDYEFSLNFEEPARYQSENWYWNNPAATCQRLMKLVAARIAKDGGSKAPTGAEALKASVDRFTVAAALIPELEASLASRLVEDVGDVELALADRMALQAIERKLPAPRRIVSGEIAGQPFIFVVSDVSEMMDRCQKVTFPGLQVFGPISVGLDFGDPKTDQLKDTGGVAPCIAIARMALAAGLPRPAAKWFVVAELQPTGQALSFTGDSRNELLAGCAREAARIEFVPYNLKVQMNFEMPRPVRQYRNHWWNPSDGLCEEIVRRAFES